ncbi:hypothetical protein OIU34_23625 [Pararhizobium sp. BT-229]|uniref:hypothetical protein n=1 Tax=Pararhizobium sp. BT-229 TaxID=2986923 RepID=UPI0021F76C9F|nr:hypothetical protein [Pararhizobium sp. BT-229]MCV9964887.1 hypothetical protein [Pararhizobium sp. BT-229]
MMKIASFALAAVLGLVSTAYARDDGFDIPKTVDLPMPHFDGRDIDIVGVKPGQPGDEAVSILKARFPKEDISFHNTDIGTDQVHSQTFNTFYTVGGDISEKMQLFLSSPSAGSQVIGAMRDKYFPKADGQPTMDTIMTELTKKYGKPDRDIIQGNSPWRTVSWYIGGDGKCAKQWFCEWPYYDHNYSHHAAEYNPAYLKEYEKDMEVGTDYVVTAEIRPEDPDMSRVSSLTVSFVDLKRRGLSAREDFNLVMSKQAEFDKKPVAAPEL